MNGVSSCPSPRTLPQIVVNIDRRHGTGRQRFHPQGPNLNQSALLRTRSRASGCCLPGSIDSVRHMFRHVRSFESRYLSRFLTSASGPFLRPLCGGSSSRDFSRLLSCLGPRTGVRNIRRETTLCSAVIFKKILQILCGAIAISCLNSKNCNILHKQKRIAISCIDSKNTIICIFCIIARKFTLCTLLLQRAALIHEDERMKAENWYAVAWMPIHDPEKSKGPTQGYESDPARAMRLPVRHDCWRLLLELFITNTHD